MKLHRLTRPKEIEPSMPVRIYDISKKLGLENKEVLVKAKELGVTILSEGEFEKLLGL